MTGIQRFKVAHKNQWDGKDKHSTVSPEKADVECLNALNAWLLDPKNGDIKVVGTNFGVAVLGNQGDKSYHWINVLFFRAEQAVAEPVVEEAVVEEPTGVVTPNPVV